MPLQPMPRGRRGGGPVAFVLPSRLANFRLLQELDASHGPVSPNKLAGPGRGRERNAELAWQLNCAANNNPGAAFGNIDDLAVTFSKATQHHPRGKVALHAPLGSLLAFEKASPWVAFGDVTESSPSPMIRSARFASRSAQGTISVWFAHGPQGQPTYSTKLPFKESVWCRFIFLVTTPRDRPIGHLRFVVIRGLQFSEIPVLVVGMERLRMRRSVTENHRVGGSIPTLIPPPLRIKLRTVHPCRCNHGARFNRRHRHLHPTRS
jgi:hypothetical protein